MTALAVVKCSVLLKAGTKLHQLYCTGLHLYKLYCIGCGHVLGKSLHCQWSSRLCFYITKSEDCTSDQVRKTIII